MSEIIKIPEGKYIGGIEVNEGDVSITYKDKKKVALVFICLNDHYWPYLGQVVRDCRQYFLPQHKVDYFAWTDYGDEGKKKFFGNLDNLYAEWQKAAPEKKQEKMNNILTVFTQIVRLYECFYPQQILQVVAELQAAGMLFKRDGAKFWVESQRPMNDNDVTLFYTAAKHILLLATSVLDESLKGVKLIDTGAIEWPAPTLMRYHLFLNEEESLKEYDYIFYMDADMRVVAKISDEILGDGITAAEHPMYSLRKEYVPPYEPNPQSTAYIKRPGKVIVDEHGNPRFKPFYYAGGFQGGKADTFIKAMKELKRNIDKDFDNNYTAIWNDESHWNKYLSENEPAIVLSPSYIYPDSLIKEYYEPLWGRSYEPKIITLTKPFTLSQQGADEINKFIKR